MNFFKEGLPRLRSIKYTVVSTLLKHHSQWVRPIDPPTGLVGVPHGGLAGLVDQRRVPGRERLRPPLPHAHQPDRAEGARQVGVEHLHDPADGNAHVVMPVGGEAQEPRAGGVLALAGLDGAAAMGTGLQMVRAPSRTHGVIVVGIFF